jgi:hypothetical protein
MKRLLDLPYIPTTCIDQCNVPLHEMDYGDTTEPCQLAR